MKFNRRTRPEKSLHGSPCQSEEATHMRTLRGVDNKGFVLSFS